jgi:aminobenzoyl-glutamate utilization protein B
VAAGGTTIGKQGMQLAARTMAATVWDLLKQPEIVSQAKAEHTRRMAGRKYEPLIHAGQKAPLDYRKNP